MTTQDNSSDVIENALTQAFHTVRAAVAVQNRQVAAMRDALRDCKERCDALTTAAEGNKERIRTLEDEHASYRRVSRLIALENENAKLRHLLSAAQQQTAESYDDRK